MRLGAEIRASAARSRRSCSPATACRSGAALVATGSSVSGARRCHQGEGRIARRAIRYNRAMEEVAVLRFAGARRQSRGLRRLRSVPLLIWVALSNPRMWLKWLELLRTGRANDAAELRAQP